jgi:hypothetical protein
LRTPKVGQIREALDKDAAASGALPWDAVKKLRSMIGEKISNAGLNPDISKKELQTLYAALSNDLRDAAYKAGPQAERAFDRANSFSAAGYNRIDTFLDRVSGKDTMEKIFNAATNPSELKEGASTINAVMRSLQPAERDVVKSSFIRRMGHATPGAQDAGGEIFSARTFLTNWNKISPEAKRTMFAGGKITEDLSAVVKAADMLDKASKVFANPSGTAQATAQQALGGGVAIALATGHVGTAGALLAAPVMANLNARLMTNPNFVAWLARSTKMPASALPSALNALSQIRLDPQTKADAERYAQSVRSLPSE